MHDLSDTGVIKNCHGAQGRTNMLATLGNRPMTERHKEPNVNKSECTNLTGLEALTLFDDFMPTQLSPLGVVRNSSACQEVLLSLEKESKASLGDLTTQEVTDLGDVRKKVSPVSLAELIPGV